MEVKTCQSKYELTEFHSYFNNASDDEHINVIELLLNTDSLDFIEKDFSNIFIVETDRHTYVFSNYEVLEYYITESGLVRVVCVK